jgi:DUF1680 family protein
MAKRKQLSPLTPVAARSVKIEGGFWGNRVAVNRAVTLPAEYRQLQDSGRIEAFRLAWKEGRPNQPHYFWDSDVAKWMEAAAYSLAARPDAELAGQLDSVIDLVASAQQPDGYLNVYFTVVAPTKRWSNLRDCHELYCAGHLIEAAVAHFEATSQTHFLDVICRYADYIESVFGPDDGKIKGYCGHEEIELALVKLYRATGREKYLKLARFFLDQRGKRPHYYDFESKLRSEKPWDDYANLQAHVPVREQATADGHAVRAMYLYCGMADVGVAMADDTLVGACRALWDSVTGRRMYITGGVGSSAQWERFTSDYDLPNHAAYAETCAAIGLVFWAHRMLQIDADGRCADVMERALYNGVMSGLSWDGSKFFYVNPLASAGKHHRQEWFGCACCPPNLARLLASLGGYFYSQSESAVYVHLYGASSVEVELGGAKVTLTQATDYPWDEKVLITVALAEPAKFELALRIPAWCSAAKIKVNGKSVPVKVEQGYARVARAWRGGDKVELTLPMEAQLVRAHPSVWADAGRAAITRGPIVYCLEGADNGANLADLALDTPAKLTVKIAQPAAKANKPNKPNRLSTKANKLSAKPDKLSAKTDGHGSNVDPLSALTDKDLLAGIPVITGKAHRRPVKPWEGKLYAPQASKPEPITITAIPYCLWDNRKSGEMVVWVREK